MSTNVKEPPHQAEKTSGMTLLEVILAVAVTGFLLSAATTFVVSISSIWMEREARNFFEDHVDGVMEFLNGTFARAGTGISASSGSGAAPSNEEAEGDGNGEPSLPEEESDPPVTLVPTEPGQENGGGSERPASGGGLLSQSTAPVEFNSPPGFTASRDPLLNFRINGVPPLLVAPDAAPSQFIEAYLYFEPDEGLSLLWTSNLQEEVETIRDLRRTGISPWVSGLRYVYWDERLERWEEEDEPMRGDGDEMLLPRFLKIEFTYEDEVRERLVALPVPSTGVPLF